MKTKKKGQLAIQFNWLFVLIIGGVILFFFIMIISNRTKAASTQEANNLVNELDTVFTTIKTETDAIKAFDIRKADINLRCEYTPPENSNEEGSYSTHLCVQDLCPISIRPDSIFAPTTIKGDEILT